MPTKRTTPANNLPSITLYVRVYDDGDVAAWMDEDDHDSYRDESYTKYQITLTFPKHTPIVKKATFNVE